MGKEVFVLHGHTSSRAITSLCLSSHEQHLFSASVDYSVRIWDMTTNQQVGNSLLRDGEVRTLVISSDGQYVTSAGFDEEINVWSLQAALNGSDKVRLYYYPLKISSNRPGAMEMHSPTRSSR